MKDFLKKAPKMFIHKQFFPYTNFLDYFGFQTKAMRRSTDSFLCFDWGENSLVVL
jgi:hypothetical protein